MSGNVEGMASVSAPAGRQCHNAVNSLHSLLYFSSDLGDDLARRGVCDPMAVYLVGRAAPLGPVGAGPVTAAFNAFSHELVATHLPTVWDDVTPAEGVASRLRAADATLRRVLGDEAVASPEMAEAAGLALRATEACSRPGRPLYSANADLPVPDAPHLVLWHAATLLREHRGDGHVTTLSHQELDGLDALVSHSASVDGMPKEIVMTKRGWSEQDWSAAEERLRDRGLMDSLGALTDAGVRLREEVERETDRLDRRPYEHLGVAGVARLVELVTAFVIAAANAGAFPPVLRDFFVPA